MDSSSRVGTCNHSAFFCPLCSFLFINSLFFSKIFQYFAHFNRNAHLVQKKGTVNVMCDAYYVF